MHVVMHAILNDDDGSSRGNRVEFPTRQRSYAVACLECDRMKKGHIRKSLTACKFHSTRSAVALKFADFVKRKSVKKRLAVKFSGTLARDRRDRACTRCAAIAIPHGFPGTLRSSADSFADLRR